MKEAIHPKYHETTITCACGNVIETRVTKPEIKVEVCSNCHPFFTGKYKLLDTAGRVEKFRKKYGTGAGTSAAAPAEGAAAAPAAAPAEGAAPAAKKTAKKAKA